MDPFRRFAVFALARDAGFVTLAAATLMVGFSFQPAIAFGIAANVALVYALVLILRAARLTADRVTRVEPWKLLKHLEDQPPPPDPGWARDTFRELLLRFAKGAAGMAVVLSASSLALNEPVSTTQALAPPVSHAAVTMSMR